VSDCKALEGPGPVASLVAGLGGYMYLTSVVCTVAVVAVMSSGRPLAFGAVADAILRANTRGNGTAYLHIATAGYSFPNEIGEDDLGDTCFFPLLPCLTRVVSTILGISPQSAALWVSQACALGAICSVIALYSGKRVGDRTLDPRHVAFAVALFPVSYYLWVFKTESLFVALQAATLLAIRCVAKPWQVCVLAGLASAARPTGIACVLPAILYVCANVRESGGSAVSKAVFVVWHSALASSGLLIYIAYLWSECGNPFCFVEVEAAWRIRSADPGDKLLAYLMCEPLLSVFRPESPCYFMRLRESPIERVLVLVNPVVLCAVAALIGIGIWKRVLNVYEVAVAIPLLAIPYLTKGHDMCCAGQARFAMSIVPAYLPAAIGIMIAPWYLRAIIGGVAVTLGVVGTIAILQ